VKNTVLTCLFCFQFLSIQAQIEIRFNLESSRFTGNGIIQDTLLALPATGNTHVSPGLGLEYTWKHGKYDLTSGILLQHFYNHIIVKQQGQTNFSFPYYSSTLEFFRLVFSVGMGIKLQKVNLGLNLLPSIRLGNGSIAMPNSPNDPFVESQTRGALGLEGLIGKSIGRRFKLALYYKTYITKTLKRSDSTGTYNFRERGIGASIFYRFKKKKS